MLDARPDALVVRLPLLFGEGLGLARGASEGLRRALESGYAFRHPELDGALAELLAR